MKDLISIIIPCYNAEKTLTGTLNSVREQSYKNLEIILVNDGSKDNTLELASHFAMIDDRIKLITQTNSGVSVARNNGLKNATGDYIVFLDADDNYTTPFALSNMLFKLKEADADMCVCNFNHLCFEQYLESGVYDLTDKTQFLKYYQDFFASSMPWNKLAKRECYTEDFIEGVKFTEDEIFNLANLHNFKKIVVTSEVYHNYYCAPYNPNEIASAVNSIYSVDKFWEKKCTVWYKGMETNNYRLNYIHHFHKNSEEDMKFVRSFDFFFWDFFMMAKNRVREEYIAETCKSIFTEKLFLESLFDKERYGLKLKTYTNSQIEEFVKLAYYAYIDIKSYNKKFSMYKVFLSLFVHFFYEGSDMIDSRDIVASTYVHLKNCTSAEAFYVKTLLDAQVVEKANNNCRIILFDKSMDLWRGVESK